MFTTFSRPQDTVIYLQKYTQGLQLWNSLFLLLVCTLKVFIYYYIVCMTSSRGTCVLCSTCKVREHLVDLVLSFKLYMSSGIET